MYTVQKPISGTFQGNINFYNNVVLDVLQRHGCKISVKIDPETGKYVGEFSKEIEGDYVQVSLPKPEQK